MLQYANARKEGVIIITNLSSINFRTELKRTNNFTSKSGIGASDDLCCYNL